MARLVMYGEIHLTIDDDALTLMQIKSSMADVFPEVRSANIAQVGNGVYIYFGNKMPALREDIVPYDPPLVYTEPKQSKKKYIDRPRTIAGTGMWITPQYALRRDRREECGRNGSQLLTPLLL